MKTKPMKPVLGQYYYRPHGRTFRIYRYTYVTPHSYSATPTAEAFLSREDARRRVYELNGWKYNADKTSS